MRVIVALRHSLWLIGYWRIVDIASIIGANHTRGSKRPTYSLDRPEFPFCCWAHIRAPITFQTCPNKEHSPEWVNPGPFNVASVHLPLPSLACLIKATPPHLQMRFSNTATWLPNIQRSSFVATLLTSSCFIHC